MYHHLSGKLVEKNPTYAVIECAGIGFLVHISLQTFSQLETGENCRLLTHLAVKEDTHHLYGFKTEEERKVFRNLISVSGIGEATAMVMLSTMSPAEITGAILTGNAALLQTIKGIGLKTAQRAIIELKDKFAKSGSSPTGGYFGSGIDNGLKEQALSALLTLGFQKSAAEKAIFEVIKQNSGLKLEDIIKGALNRL